MSVPVNNTIRIAIVIIVTASLALLVSFMRYGKLQFKTKDTVEIIVTSNSNFDPVLMTHGVHSITLFSDTTQNPDKWRTLKGYRVPLNTLDCQDLNLSILVGKQLVVVSPSGRRYKVRKPPSGKSVLPGNAQIYWATQDFDQPLARGKAGITLIRSIKGITLR